MDTVPNGHNPESTRSRLGEVPNGQDPVETIPKGHLHVNAVT